MIHQLLLVVTLVGDERVTRAVPRKPPGLLALGVSRT